LSRRKNLLNRREPKRRNSARRQPKRKRLKILQRRRHLRMLSAKGKR